MASRIEVLAAEGYSITTRDEVVTDLRVYASALPHSPLCVGSQGPVRYPKINIKLISDSMETFQIYISCSNEHISKTVTISTCLYVNWEKKDKHL